MEFICNQSISNNNVSGNSKKLSVNNVSYPCGTMEASEPGQDHLNYYLPHCDTGITYVPGFKRIVYEEAFSNIDYHFYSNEQGLKSYIVIKPGGNPNDILLRFSGQDSLQIIDSNILFYMYSGVPLSIPQATAYQIDSSNNPIAITWDPVWINQGNGNVSLQTSTYNSNLPLIIRIAGLNMGAPEANIPGVYWSTYYGGNAYETIKDIKADASANLYETSETASSNFPTKNGFQSKFGGGDRDAYITKFNANTEREWATYYGGDGSEIPNKIAISNKFSEVYIIGTVESAKAGFTNSLPPANISGAYTQTNYGGGLSDAFVGAFNNSDGKLYWSTYFGGSGTEIGNSILLAEDDNDKTVFIVGATSSSNLTASCILPTAGEFPVCATGAAYDQNFNSGDFDGFVAEFGYADLSHPTNALIWSTLFGGDGFDEIKDIAQNISSDIVICGSTNSTKVPNIIGTPYVASTTVFPIAGDINNSYIQTDFGGTDGFVARFNGSHALVWSTFFGGEGHDELTSIAIKNYTNKIYAVGFTTSDRSVSSCVVPTAGDIGKIPICNPGGSGFTQLTFGGSSDALLTKFDIDGSLEWSTYYGGSATEGTVNNLAGQDVNVVVKNNDVYIAGSSGTGTNFSGTELITANPNSLFIQNNNASFGKSIYFWDGYVLAFGSANERKWATFFGGGQIGNSTNSFADEAINGIAASGEKLFIAGSTNNSYNTTPYECPQTFNPTCNKSINGSTDGFITRFDVPKFSIGIKSLITNKTNFKVYPNPSSKIILLDIPFSETGDAVINIYDISGRLVISKNIIGEFGITQDIIDVSLLTNGLYFISVNTNKNTYATKFVKQ